MKSETILRPIRGALLCTSAQPDTHIVGLEGTVHISVKQQWCHDDEEATEKWWGYMKRSAYSQ